MMDLSEFTSHIQLFSSFLVAMTGAVVALGAVIRPMRNWIIDRIGNKRRGEELQKAVTAIGTDLKNLSVRFDEERAEQALMKDANIASLRNDLTELYYKVYPQGYIGEYDLKNWISMFEVYTALGGNHYVAELDERVRKLPGKPPKKKRTTKR